MLVLYALRGRLPDGRRYCQHPLSVALSQTCPIPSRRFADVDEIAERLRDADPVVRRLAVKELGETALAEAEPLIITAVADAAGEVRLQAAQALGEFDGHNVAEALALLLEDRDAVVAKAAAESLANLKSPQAGPPILGLVDDTNPFVAPPLCAP